MRSRNPMSDPAVARRAYRTRAVIEGPSKIELRLSAFVKKRSLPVSYRGNGRLWINRRNPDFRVIGQKKILEVTTSGIFNGWEVIQRSAADYGAASVVHYEKSGWRCLVVFCHQDYRRALPEKLATAISAFASPDSAWSGVWDYETLLRFDVSTGLFSSIT